MNIGFYLEVNSCKDTDLRFVEQEGNPGVGGTIFAFSMCATMLAKSKEFAKNQIVFYHTGNILLDDHVECVRVENMEQAFDDATKRKVEIFVVRSIYSDKELDIINSHQMKIIVWLHNFATEKELLLYKKCNNIKKIVFVGRQHYDWYIDHHLNEKAYFIYNPVSVPAIKDYSSQEIQSRVQSNIVTYIGSLTPEKGFGLLAKIWKKILKEVPDAKLHVIGSGNLYNSDLNLGKWNVAEEKYENVFISYLLDEKGELLDSVIFDGIMGTEKFDIIAKTAVGVVNPTGNTETFCISAVEMEMLGIPVVTARRCGLLDTVKHRVSGLTSNSNRKLGKNIVKLLTDHDLNQKMGKSAQEYVTDKFSLEQVCNEWIRLLQSVQQNENIRIQQENKYDYIMHDCKWLRIVNRKIKKLFGCDKLPAIFEWHTKLSKIKRKILK